MIEPKFDRADVANALNKAIDALQARTVATLQYVGEVCINEARDSGSYTDRTGNLRSSIGYVIAKDGTIITESAFPRVMGTADKGPETGRELAERIARECEPGSYALVVVAGMKYAVHVTNRGYNVLNSAELIARQLAPEMLLKLNENRDADTK